MASNNPKQRESKAAEQRPGSRAYHAVGQAPEPEDHPIRRGTPEWDRAHPVPGLAHDRTIYPHEEDPTSE